MVFQNTSGGKMSQQAINLLIIVLLLVHGEAGGSGLFEESLGGHLPPGPSDLPDPFLPGPYDVDHHHISRLSSIHTFIVLKYNHCHVILIVPNSNPPERSWDSWTTIWTFTLPTPPAPFRFLVFVQFPLKF